MDEESLKDASREAWKEVLAHPAADLRRYLEQSRNTTFKGGKKPVAAVCPLCNGKNKFGLTPTPDGIWLFKCFSNTCSANEGGRGLEDFLKREHSCDWKQARAMMHQMTGVPGFEELLEEKRCKNKIAKDSPPPANATGNDTHNHESSASERSGNPPPPTETGDDTTAGGDDAPDFIRIPDLGRNVYETAWLLLSLTNDHRRELRTKRGLPDEWIDALGFRSSLRGNRELLEPLLEKFPINDLLRSGIAVRRRDDWKKLRIADQLCGKAVKKNRETGEETFGDDERVIIPYIDSDGRIVGLRPHKMGLSNSEHRNEVASEFYEKNHHNLRIVYGEHFLVDRPERHAHRCVICEGEHKAQALAYCGIPAIGFQGIEFLYQNRETGQAERQLVALLRKHKIREVVVIFDNEDKTGKELKRRKDEFIAEIWARYTALKLEDNGFQALFGVLPDAWMEDGKADWDSRLAWHLRRAKNDHRRARTVANLEFERFITARQTRTGSDGTRIPPTVIPVPRQMEWLMSFKEDVIGQELNRLNFDPDCFKGGKHDLDTAAEINGHCHPLFRDLLGAEKLASNLRKCYGGFYVVKPPSEKLEARTALLKHVLSRELEGGLDDFEIKDKSIATLVKALTKEEHSEERTRGIRAALLACNTILYRNPKPFSDFTIISKYKVMVTEPDGSIRKDRLCIFIDRNGRKSKPQQIDWSRMSSAQEARKVLNKLDGYHFSGGQNEIDPMVALIDVDNYQQTIIEIDTYGHDRDSGLILMGDCALSDDPAKPFLFPDNQGIIWHRGIGYKNSESLDTFCHKPPLLFPGTPNAKKAYQEIDWEQERREVALIWEKAITIATSSFGDMSGYGMIGGLLQYLAHPETLSQLSGKPGLWVQGAKGSGKTQTIKAYMRMLGYVENYGLVGLTGTKVGIERSLSQFDCLPVHIDEWRNNRADDNLVGFITNAYNGIAIAKGTAMGSKSIRLSRAATIPVVTGEDMTIDAALLSRYFRLTMSRASRTGSKDEQDANFSEMQEISSQFYRIGRYLMKHRAEYARKVCDKALEMKGLKHTTNAISDPRARECVSICFAALEEAQHLITGEFFENGGEIAQWFVEHGRTSSQEIEKDIFRLRWFSDCVSMISANADPNVKKFLQVRRAGIAADNSINVLKGNMADIYRKGEGRLLILVAAKELFSAYQREQAKQRETVPINIRNIGHELRRERCWIPAPKKGAGTHRFTVEGFHTQSWWVLDYETSGDLKDIVSTIYEQALNDHELELMPDGRVVPMGSYQP
ncbi:MAG: DUF3854 domain-containing protein, partial [Verrucomicrobiaceae bacterium]